MYDYTDNELKDVLRTVKNLWDRRVTAQDAYICEDLFIEYDLDPETIKYLMGLAKKRGAATLKYLYPLAEIIRSNNINDATAAEIIIEKNISKYTNILQYINYSKNRIPTKAEKEKIDEIFHEYDPTEEEIREVGNITKNANRPSLIYFETVLKNKRKDSH